MHYIKMLYGISDICNKVLMDFKNGRLRNQVQGLHIQVSYRQSF